MPLRLSFFDDPLLRITPPSELNDPFDSKPTQIGIEKKIQFFISEDSEFGDYQASPESIKETYENDLRNGLNEFGVISLTEDPYNLLMWSHYANEHKGLIISICCDSSTFDYHDKFTEKCGVSKKEPERVIYSNRRPGYDMPDNTIYEYFEHNFYTHFAMTKGNDWIYEKEHRYLIRLTEADAAIVIANSSDWASKQTQDVIITPIGGSKYKVEASSPSKRDFLSWFLAFAQGRREISDIKLFKRLKQNALTGVYFGCRVTDEEIVKVKEKIESNHLLGNSISLYKSIENQDRFEIDFERLE